MSTQIAIRLPDEAVAFLDEQVSNGAAKSRADFVWRAIKREQRRLSAERDLAVLAEQPYDEFAPMHGFVKQQGYSSPD